MTPISPSRLTPTFRTVSANDIGRTCQTHPKPRNRDPEMGCVVRHQRVGAAVDGRFRHHFVVRECP
jgi:hypothetical protein